jgi:hypothetical protein
LCKAPSCGDADSLARQQAKLIGQANRFYQARKRLLPSGGESN